MLIIVALTMLFSCDKKKEIKQKPDAFMNAVFEFSFKSKNGDDMLNPKTSGSYNHNEIEVWALESGIQKIINNNSSDLLSNERGFYTLSVNLVKNTTLLKLSDNVTDTIVTELESGTNFQYITKIWYNGKLAWEKGDNISFLTIVK